jgi:hypothetical protein
MSKIFFSTLILGFLIISEIKVQAQDEQVSIQRLLYFYHLKSQLADKSWPGFGLPQFDVDLAYFTHSNTYIITPSGLIGTKKSLIPIYKNAKFTIAKTDRLDTIPFHMATAYDGHDTSSLWYHNPVLLCSDYETTRKYVEDVPNLQTWATMVLHEYFHGFQFRHQAFIQFANDSITLSISKLQSYYDKYSWFKESIDKENQLLLDCLSSKDLNTIKQFFIQYKAQRLWRLKYFYELEGFDLSAQEEFLEKMEGSARYMEYKLYLTLRNLPPDKQLMHVDTTYKPLAFKTFSLKDKSWMYASNSVRYFYSTGFNILRLLDKMHVYYKGDFFDDNNLTPYKLLNKDLDN